MATPPIYYRRDIGHGVENVAAFVVYALFPDAPAPSPAIVACVGAFPHGYRPTEQPGQVLGDPTNTMQFWTCDVERAQLRRYLPITEREAFVLYPRLAHFVAAAQRAIAETGDLPAGRE